VSFKDHFSRLASSYARFRPTYPPQLAAHLAAMSPARSLALDVATGNGQAAVDLAQHFDLVLASDASARQLVEAAAHPRIRYLRHAAECLPVRAGSVDLVAVAQAAHWFDLDRFYAEARRVLRPDGVVALWTYGLFSIDTEIDALVGRFYSATVGTFWPPERRYVEEEYRTLPFPLRDIPAPPFEMTADWSLEDVLSYLRTWSAVDRYRADRGEDPVLQIADTLRALWGTAGRRRLRWPVHLRLGKFPAGPPVRN
jgi:SAM-dependent methyltransferase